MNFREMVEENYRLQEQKRLSHQEVLAKAEEIGWKKARKSAGIWAKPIPEPITVQTKEGPVQVSQAQIDTGQKDPSKAPWLSQGIEGEQWPQDRGNIDKKYKETSQTKNGWTYFEPSGPPVEVSQIDRPFEVQASWGRLEGKAGDWVVRNPQNPKDVWLIDNDIFEKTYKVE